MKKPIPRTDSGTPPREEQVSSHDFHLPSLLDATDDEDSGEDTGILLTSVQQPHGGDPFQAFAVYIHGKHKRLTKRVVGLERKLDRATWTVSLAAAFGLALFELLKLFLSTTHGK